MSFDTQRIEIFSKKQIMKVSLISKTCEIKIFHDIEVEWLLERIENKEEVDMGKKKLTAFLCALATACLATTPVLAANTTDKPYSYTSITATTYHETTHYEKTNDSKVYVKPSKSPSGKTHVRTYCNVGGVSTNKTVAGTVTLSNNKAYGITNYVYEHGDRTDQNWVMMWLMVKATSGAGQVSGNWSPDWSGTTSVTIV